MAVDPDLFWLLYYYIKRQAKVKNTKIRRKQENFWHIPLRKLARKRKMKLLSILIAHHYRERLVWMYPSTNAWFVMADTTLDDQRWYANFRVSRNTFQYILDQIKDEIIHEDTRLRPAVTPKCRLAITLYYLSSTAEYRTIANLFGVSPSFVCNCVREVFQAILDTMKTSFIFLPKGEELDEIVNVYKEKWGFPMCGGAIDGTHIPIIAPTENHADYINRKGYHSIVMQAVVDSGYLFRDVVGGWPGSVHDARVLSNSHLYQLGNEGKLFSGGISEDINGTIINPLLLGDPAYPLLPWMMKPYPETPDISPSHKNFNFRLSRARMTVENTFGRWKGRFRRFLKKVDMHVSNVTLAVAASCILHNLCEISHEEILDEWLVDVRPSDAAGHQNEFQMADLLVRADSSNVRDALAEFSMSDAGALTR